MIYKTHHKYVQDYLSFYYGYVASLSKNQEPGAQLNPPEKNQIQSEEQEKEE